MAGGGLGGSLSDRPVEAAFPASGAGGMTISDDLYASLPASFVRWYRQTFRGSRMLYGHWSGGLYTRAVGSYHRQIAVLKPLELDERIERFFEARNRRIGGALSALWNEVERLKQSVEVQIFESAPWDRDLPAHTRGRDTNSIAIAMMCGHGARPNDLGLVAPLPAQLRAMVRLVAQACIAVRSPVERFLTHSEAADNLDYPRTDDPAAPAPAHGFRTTRQACDLEAWIDEESAMLAAPLQTARKGWRRLGDWLREQVVREIVEQTRNEWHRSG